MLTIEEIKQIPPDCKEMPTNPTLKATALEVGEIEAGQGKTKATFFCILADNTGAILCTVYKDNEKQKFVEDLGVVIMNVIRIGINISSRNLFPNPINYFLLCNVYS